MGVGRGFDECETRIEGIIKSVYCILLLKTVKDENGGPQPSRVIENEKKLKERGKKCVPLSGLEPRTLSLEVLHLTTRLKLQNGI